MLRKLIFIAVLLILHVPRESTATMVRTFLKFVEGGSPGGGTVQPPSQSPVPSIVSPSTGRGAGNVVPAGTSVKAKLTGSVTDERCLISSSTQCQVPKNVTACLSFSGTGSQGSFLIIQNDEEALLKVHATIWPSEIASEDIEVRKHQAIRINISAYLEGSRSILIHAGNGSCTIETTVSVGSPAPGINYGEHFPYDTYFVKPMHGAYLLGVIILISGGAWACFKLRKGNGRHRDGIPYQELEMGKPESLAAVNVETADGWDQNWDDDWDEEKAVKSPGEKRLRNRQANGLASRSPNNDGWENDWDE